MNVTPEELQALADKLDGLDLNDAETAILEAVFERAAAAEPEVEGFFNIERWHLEAYLQAPTPTAQKLAGVFVDLASRDGSDT